MSRVIGILAGILGVVGIFLLGAYVEYSTSLPFGRGMIAMAEFYAPRPTPAPITANNPALQNAPRTRTDVPIVSNARGAEDAPRADTPQGATIDLQRCYATMIARRLGSDEAKTVCAKLIGGITH